MLMCLCLDHMLRKIYHFMKILECQYWCGFSFVFPPTSRAHLKKSKLYLITYMCISFGFFNLSLFLVRESLDGLDTGAPTKARVCFQAH